jgi:7-cyano-7-deazaguanine synthase in queuosine biosynthesis
LDPVAADLLDVAASVFLIERCLPGKQHVNRPVKINAEIGLRAPSVWSPKAIAALQELLLFMGWTHWEFHFSKPEKYDLPLVVSRGAGELEQVSLFSGGLDSLCGAGTERDNKGIRLVSYYSKQKELQRDLALGLGMIAPVQWSTYESNFSGRGTNYLYRSFMFLSLAAITARSYGASKIQQFENGILASSIPPSLSDRSTKHAHYRVHRLCETIFTEVLGGDWQISNPFELMTKREAFNALIKKIGKNQANNLAERTQSCWHLNAGFKLNGHIKENGLPCGFCVPCIVRQTAHPLRTWRDLRTDAARNHRIHGRNFREFYAMLCDVQIAKGKSLHDFYLALGSQAQDAIKPRGAYQLTELKDLFSRFADEFMSTFEVGVNK